MAADPIATFLAFANVQMAAEAKFPGGFSGTGTALRNGRDAVRAIAALEADAGRCRWASLQDGRQAAEAV